MPPESPRHHISVSPIIRDRLLVLSRHAKASGILSSWISSSRAAFERLELEPETAGDPLHRLRNMNLTVYRLLMNRVCIVYAVHDWERIIFIQSIDPVLGHPLEGQE